MTVSPSQKPANSGAEGRQGLRPMKSGRAGSCNALAISSRSGEIHRRIQPQRGGHEQVNNVVAVTQMRRLVGLSSAAATLRGSARRPTFVGLA